MGFTGHAVASSLREEEEEKKRRNRNAVWMYSINALPKYT